MSTPTTNSPLSDAAASPVLLLALASIHAVTSKPVQPKLRQTSLNIKPSEYIIAHQEKAVADILALKHYPNSTAFLNKLGRSVSAIRRAYWKQAEANGFTEKQINQQWRDIRDIAELEHNAEE